MGYFNIPMVLWFVLLVVNFWSKRYLRNHCPLAANFGTKGCNFYCGGLILHRWIILLGGILCIFSHVRRWFFFCYRDIFSVIKLRGFLTCRGEVSDYMCSKEVINWIWNYNIICSESCFVFPSTLVSFRVGGCYSVIADFGLLFMT